MEGLNIMEESPGLNQCLRIRRFRRDDLESVLIVERECFSESERFDQLTFTYYLRLDSIFLIAEWCDKSVVGYALGFSKTR